MLLLLRALILPGLVLVTNAASIKDYPWMVTIHRSESFKPSEIWCGGSVISNRAVLTASRCLRWVKFNELTVQAGTDDLADGRGVWYDAEKFYIHPDAVTLSSAAWNNDIGVIVVIGYFGKDVKPVPLTVVPTTSGMQIDVQGYGRLLPGGLQHPRTKLWSRKLFVRPGEVCGKRSQMIYQITQYPSDKQGCTTDPNRNFDHCIMTIGGPVTICGILVGIQSWGENCDEHHNPMIFTEVAWYNEWIYNVTKS